MSLFFVLFLLTTKQFSFHILTLILIFVLIKIVEIICLFGLIEIIKGNTKFVFPCDFFFLNNIF
jgi:hypothetical protein